MARTQRTDARMTSSLPGVGDATTSESLYRRACELLPGGVSSPVRAFRAVGGVPRFIRRGAGAYVDDVDGNRYLDLVMSWGPLILGHAHPAVVEAITAAARRGTSFGAPSPIEVELAQHVVDTFPSIELVRFVNSGTEAVMSALRLARAATGRTRIIKCEGCYHGHTDAMLAAAGSGVASLGLPDSPGVPPGGVVDTLLVPFNDLGAVERLFVEYPDTIGAVIIEPVAGNMGVIPPVPGFLEGLRAVTTAHGTLLIFDEVMTGWRVGPRGAQGAFGIEPDLTCLGKVVGGGLPAAAFGGRRELMEQLAPTGPVYQAGTLSGNPVAMAAGLATLTCLEDGMPWKAAAAWAEHACSLIEAEAKRAGRAVAVQRMGTMFTVFFTGGPVQDFRDAKATDHEAYALWFHRMLRAGVFFPPSPYEAAFTSAAHGERELDVLERALRNAFA